MDETIDKLQIEINAKATGTSKGLDKLTQSIERIKAVVGDSTQGLGKIAASMAVLQNAVYGAKDSAGNITGLAKALERIQSVKMSGIGANMEEISRATKSFGSIGDIALSIKDFGKGITSMKTTMQKLNDMDFTGTADKIKQMVQVLRPLTDEMVRAGPAAASYGSSMRDLAQAMRTANNAGKLTYELTENAKRLNNTMHGLSFAKFAAGFYVLKRVGSVIGGFINNINGYIESMNLFTVAMGEGADEGQRFAQKMQDILGIDAGEAMKNMGLFQQITTSFGVAADKATILSKNITQLAYDYASFHNIATADSFLKLQSAMAGELEPVRRLGKDVSQARLQQELYTLGIDASVTSLNRADKAILTYIALMKQSTNEMGDMSRTIQSPANALRVLQSQLTIAGRAIGSIFIPALTTALPYVIAFTKVIGEAASAVAAFFGFEMPKIDYSSLGNAGIATGGLSDNMDELAENTKEAKKQMNALIGGFDELNVLQKDEGKAGGIGGSIGGSILGDIKLPEYDMFAGAIENQVDKIAKDIRSFFDEWKDEIAIVAKLLIGLFAIKKIFDMIKWFKKLYDAFKALFIIKELSKGVSGFFDAFHLAKMEGGVSTVGALTQGLKAFRDSLSPLAKLVITLGGAIAAFAITYNIFDDVARGTKSWGEALIITVPLVGGLAIAIGLLVNPIAGIVVALAGVVGGIIGFNEEQKRLQEEFIQASFFDGIGASLDVFNGYLRDGYRDAFALNEKIEGLSATLGLNKDAIADSQIELGKYQGILSATGTLTKEEAEKMESSFQTLIDKMRQNLELDTDIIFLAFNDSAKKAAEDLGYNVGTMTTILNGFKQTFGQATNELESQLQPFWDDLKAGKILTPEDQKEFERLLTYSSELATGVSETQVKLEDQIGNISKINFDNLDEATRKIGEIQKTGDELLTGLDASKIAALTSIEDMKKDAKVFLDMGSITQESYNQSMKMFQQFAISITAGYERDKSQVEASLSAVFGAIELSLDKQIDDVTQKTAPTFMQKVIAGLPLKEGDRVSVEKQVKDTINKQIGDPIRKAIEEAGTSLGVVANKELGQNLLSGTSLGLQDKTELDKVKSSVTSMANMTIDETRFLFGEHSPSTVFKEIGKYTIEGLNLGISENSFLAVDAIGVMTKESINKAETDLSAVNSPSLVFKDIGKNVDEGYSLGIMDNLKTVNNAMSKFKSGILDVFKNIDSEVSKYVSSMQTSINGFLDSMEELKKAKPPVIRQFSDDNERSYNSYNSDARNIEQIPALARGGAVYGETVALIGDNANARQDPEIVAAESLIEKIVANNNGSDKVASLLVQLIEAVESKSTTVNIDGNEVGRTVDNYNANRGMSISKSVFANLY